jgi:ribosomal protein S18 acetylase RimI-like enzyme
MTDRTWYLYWIAVEKLAHGRGIGARLMRLVEESIAGAGGRQLLIETSSLPNYDATRRFYLKQGYELAATVPDYYADRDSMVVFRKRFEPLAAS